MIVFDRHRAAGLDLEAAGARDRGLELLKKGNQFLGDLVARAGRFANRDPLLYDPLAACKTLANKKIRLDSVKRMTKTQNTS